MISGIGTQQTSSGDEPFNDVPLIATECLEFRPSHIPLCGREDELNVLRDAYAKTTRLENPTATAVFIRGESGTGKSALIREFRNILKAYRYSNDQQQLPCIFCRAKFEEGGAVAQPFGSVLQACSSLMQQLLGGATEISLDVWRNRFEAAFSTQDSTILQNMIPSVRRLLQRGSQAAVVPEDAPDDSSVRDNSSSAKVGDSSVKGGAARRRRTKVTEFVPTREIMDPSDTEFSFDRLRFALRSLLRTVSQFTPLVLFLDDLQWAGEDSLVLVQTLIYDRVPDRRLLLIGAYRPVADNHPFTVRVLREPQNHRLIVRTKTGQVKQPSWIDLHLEGLDISATRELIASVLKVVGNRDVGTLTSYVFEKTKGSPLLVLQLLRALEKEKLIFFSKHANHWTWKAIVDLHDNESLQNVGDIVNRNIRAMALLHQQVLSSAACLGVLRFRVSLLMLVLGSSQRRDLERVLLDLVQTGVLEQASSSEEFRFAHDRIREAAYSLFAHDDDRKLTHLAIGKRLLHAGQSAEAKAHHGLQGDFEEEVMLHALRQLSLGASYLSTMDERREVAEISHMIALVAVSRSAFFPAADFLSIGLSVLSSEHVTSKSDEWQQSYPLMLKLSIDKARIDYCCGSWDSAIKHADSVLAHSSSILDNSQAYLTKVMCLVQQDKIFEAKTIILSVLEQLGVVFPPGRVRRRNVIIELLRVKVMISRCSEDDLVNLQETDDCFANLSGDFFLQLHYIAYLSSTDRELLMLLFLQVVRMNLTNGRFRYSGFGFVCYGLLLMYLGKYNEAYHFGKIGLRVVEMDGHHAVLAHSVFYAYISHWQYPVHHCVDRFAKLVKHFSYSEPIVSLYHLAGFAAGRPLNDMKRDIFQCAEALLDYQEFVYYDGLAPLFQLVDILTGSSPTQLNLTGSFMDEHEILEKTKSVHTKFQLCLYRLYLLCILGDLGLSGDLLAEMDQLQYLKQLSLDSALWMFYGGLASFAMARSSSDARSRRRYKRKGRSMMREFQRWTAKGVVQAPFYLAVLRADNLSLSCSWGVSNREKMEAVLKVYDSAIVYTINLSNLYYMNLRALASEKAAVFCLEHNQAARAAEYMLQARDMYKAWGASAKVLQLEEKYPFLFGT
jgi:predicted ATPase